MRRAPPSWLSQSITVFRKDLAIELATGEVVSTSTFFGVLVVVLASLAFYVGAGEGHRVAPGVIWIATAFSSVLAIGRSWHREREDAALVGLLSTPVARSAVFAGKALGMLVFVGLVLVVIVPISALLFQLDLAATGLGLAVIAASAVPGVAASGTLFGAMTVRTRARDLVLATVLFPLLSPTLLAAVAATRELLAGAPLGALGDYLAIMAVFDVVFMAGGLALFDVLIEG